MTITRRTLPGTSAAALAPSGATAQADGIGAAFALGPSAHT